MLKFTTTAAALVSLTGLVSCFSPYDPYDAPPPNFHPNPPYPPQRVNPGDGQSYSPDPYANQPLPPAYGAGSSTAPGTPPPTRPTPPAAGSYPTATRTANPNQVLSPYEPYNVIDVEGFKSGQLARDPSNQKIFRIP